MRSFTLLAILILFFSDGLMAQRRVIRQAQTQIANERYIQAIETLQPLLRRTPVADEVYLLLGMSYLSVPGGSESALMYLEKAVELYPIERRPSQSALEARFYLGQAMHLNYRFEDAIKLFDELKPLIPSSRRQLIAAIERERLYSINAIELIKHPVNYDIHTLGPGINTLYDEHSPVVSLDESSVFFTSNRPIGGMTNDANRYFENIYVSYWREGAWTAAQLLELPGGYLGNRATVSVSSDGQTLLFYQSDGAVGNLYMTRLRFGVWTEPEILPPPITSPFNETHASFSVDGNSIWFTSDRPGGYGGKDIYVSHLLPDGNWGEPINAGPAINTPMDEESPFLHPNGTTLYFSSEGHNSMGGYDIFRSELSDDGVWSSAQNLGYPINTPDDDLFYMPTPDGQRVYYASSRPGGMGFTDLYLISFPVEDERSLAVMASHIYGMDEKPVADAVVRVYNTDNNESMGVFRPNPLNGKVVAVLSSARNYRIEVEAEGYQSYKYEFTIPLRDVYGTRQRAFYLPTIVLMKE